MKTKIYVCLRNVITFMFKWFGIVGLLLIIPIILSDKALFKWTKTLLKRK